MSSGQYVLMGDFTYTGRTITLPPEAFAVVEVFRWSRVQCLFLLGSV